MQLTGYAISSYKYPLRDKGRMMDHGAFVDNKL